MKQLATLGLVFTTVCHLAFQLLLQRSGLLSVRVVLVHNFEK